MNARATDQSAISIVDRVHELVAEALRTPRDVEGNAALRSALLHLEQLGASVVELEAAAMRNDERHAESIRAVRLRAEHAEARLAELQARTQPSGRNEGHADAAE